VQLKTNLGNAFSGLSRYGNNHAEIGRRFSKIAAVQTLAPAVKREAEEDWN
jgi:hypothetical protein